MERAGWANCLPLYFYICIDIYDMKQMEGSAEKAVHLFYLSVSVNPLLTFSAGCKSSRSLCANARSVRALTHCSSWVPTSHTWGACPVLCVFLIHGICHALISAIPAPWPFLQQRTMLQIQGTAACGWDRGFSSLTMVSKSTTLASSLAAWRTASAFVCFIQNL